MKSRRNFRAAFLLLPKKISLTRKERYRQFIDYFTQHQPNADTELEYKDPYQLLVAVILSAQCTDKRVNLITPAFFGRFPDAKSLAEAGQDEVFELIKSCSYPNNKSKHLRGMAQKLTGDFGGIVPNTVEDLMKLPGVGRKTANVIASVVYSQPAMAVDTHVFRVAARIGLTLGAKTPAAAEKQLVQWIPEEHIPRAHHWLILHGRYVCQARKPKCDICRISDFCKYFQQQKKAESVNLNKS